MQDARTVAVAAGTHLGRAAGAHVAEAVATEGDGGEAMSEELSNKSERDFLRCQIGTSKETAESAGAEDETLEAWLDRAQKARERMAIDEEYRKQIARGIS